MKKKIIIFNNKLHITLNNWMLNTAKNSQRTKVNFIIKDSYIFIIK
jgi:hypothetical protein